MPYDYRTVKDQYDMLHEAGVVSEPLETWSARKNQESGTDAYNAGLEGSSYIKDLSVGLDKLLEMTGVPAVTGAIGGAVGSGFEALGLEGAAEEGAKMGRKVPRGLVNYLPMGLSVLGPGGVAAGVAGTAALSGAETYEETGSPAASLISGGVAAAMPGVGGLARKAVLKGLGAEEVTGQVVGGVEKLLQRAGITGAEEALPGMLAAGAPTRRIAEYIPKNLGQGLAAYGAEQAVGSVMGEAGNIAAAQFSDQPYEFSPTTALLNMTVGQLPFAAQSAFRHGRVQFGMGAARAHEAQLKTSVELSEKAIEAHRLNEEESGKTTFEVAPDTPEEVAARETRVARLSELREKQRAARADGTTVGEAERQKLADEDNSILAEQWGKKPMPGYIMGVPVDAMPERPAMTDDPVVRLQTAEQRMAAAKDNVDVQDAIGDINDVRQRYGMKPLDDAEIVNRQQRLSLGSDREAIQSHIDETRRLATAKEEGAALKTEVNLKMAELQHPDPMVAAAALARLKEIHRGTEDLDNVRVIANAPLNRDSAPVKSFMNEQATRIVESDPRDVPPEDKQKFLDYVQGGTTALMKNHAMGAEEAGNWLNENSVVKSWKNRLEMQVKDGLTFQDYAERHLMQQGVTETEAKTKAAVATELAGKPDLTDNLLATPTEGAEVKKAGAAMADLLASEPEPTKQIFDEAKVANADELYDKFVRSGADENVLVNLDQPVKDYIYAKAREHRQLVDVMKSAEDTEYVNSPVESPEVVQRALRDIGNIETKQIKQAADVSGLSGMAPKTFMDNLVNRYQEFKPEFMDPIEGGVRRFADAFKTPAWLSKISQHLAEFVSKGHQLSPNIRKMAFESFKAFGMDEKGNWDKQLVKSMKDQQVRKALSQWIGINQRIGSKMVGGDPDTALGVKVIPPDHPDVAKALAGLSPEKQAAVKDLMARQEISTKTMQQEELGKMGEIATTQGTEFLGPRTGLKYDQNLKLSNDMMSLVKVDWNDPAQAQQGQELMSKLQMQFADKPEVYTEFYRTMGEKWAEIQQKQAFFEKNPAWATEQGYGKYTFTYLKGNKLIKDTADSKAQAREIANGNQIKDLIPNDNYHDTPVNYEREIPIEQADSRWFDNHVTWLNKNATYWSRALYRAQSRALLNDPEMSQRPDVLRLAKQHSDNMLSTDPALGKMANGFVSSWYLAFNVASAMVNATQLMTRGAAEMTKLTGNPVKSYNRIMRGYKDMYDMWAPGAAGLSDEKQRIVQRLERDGVTTVTAEMLGAGDSDPGLDLKRMLSGRGPLKSLPSNLARVYQNAGMWMFKKMERVNNIGAVFAAFDHYRTQKDAYGKQVSFDDAYNRALQFNQAVNDVGGKANRPIDLMSGAGEISKSLGLMATSLQTYNIGTIGQIMSYIKSGKFDPPDLNPGQKYHYKKALVHLLGTQAVAAGAIGMPFLGTALAVIQQAWPELEAEKHLRGWVNQGFAKLLNDDEEDGGTLADIAMTGIPSMFGWDFQSRLSMGNPMMGVSEINGIQPQLLIGTPAEMAGKFLKGGTQMVSGAPPMSYVGDMIPPFAKKLLDLAQSGGKILDYNGKPVLEQTTPGEKVGMAMGFQPTRMSEFRKANRMKSRSEAASDAEVKQFNQQQAAELVASGNFGDIKNRLRARAEEKLKTDPSYNVETQARQIVDAAEALTFPNDLRRKLSAKDSQIAKWFTLPLNQPAEVQRAQFKATMLRNLGVAYKPKDMQKYALMDQIEAQNPGTYTRTEKRRMAEKAMNRSQRTPQLAGDSG